MAKGNGKSSNDKVIDADGPAPLHSPDDNGLAYRY